MATQREKGWLADRLRPLCYSLHDLAVMTGEHYRQATRWNSGRYEPPTQVMEWVGKLERFFAANPPPKRADYVAARSTPAADQPPPFVQRIIDAMKPGETASVDDLMARLGASRKSIGNRLSAAGVAGRLGPLRRVAGGIYRAVEGEIPPGGSLEFPPVVEKGVTGFVGQILDVVKPGEALDLSEVSVRMGVRTDVIAKQLAKAAESDRLGPIERVGETAIRRMEEDIEDEQAPPPVRAAPPPKPRAEKPPEEVRPMTTDEGRALLKEMGWGQRDLGETLQWPGNAQREVRRWFQDHERFPMPPEVATWLRAMVQAKRTVEARLSPDLPPEVAAGVVAASLAAALGDPTKVRDAALEARRMRPRVPREGAGHGAR